MCDYWIIIKNAPLLGGEMEEIVKGLVFYKHRLSKLILLFKILFDLI